MQQRIIALTITAVILACAVAVSFAQAEPPRQLPTEKADYPLCVTVRPAPLLRSRGVPLNPRLSEAV